MQGPAGPRAADARTPLLVVAGLSKTYTSARGKGPGTVALSDVGLDVFSGECVGIVGQSGSGKSTLGACIAGLLEPTAGKISFDGRDVARPGVKSSIPRVRGVQIVFQDPYSSLNPRRTVGSVLSELLRVHDLCPRREVERRVAGLLTTVGLRPEVRGRRPRQLSGGQRQRVAIARALALEPRLVVADEIVSALDASVQAQILNLLMDLQEQLDVAVVFISHDFTVVRQLCDRIIVMHRGVVVEQGDTDTILEHPVHDYTRMLLGAIPRLETRRTSSTDVAQEHR